MEHVEGETLRKRLEKGPLPVDEAIEYAAQMADTLEKAHQKGIVHRDLKPSNVMLASSRVKLLDFGLAKWSGAPGGGLATVGNAHDGQSGDSEPLTEEGSILETFRYMAPEQLEGKGADTHTDIYTLCLVLHEMITGKRVFEDASRAGLIAAILKEKPPALNELQPVTPPQLDRVVQTGLEKDPGQTMAVGPGSETRPGMDRVGTTGHAGSNRARPRDRGRERESRSRLRWSRLPPSSGRCGQRPVPVAETVRFEIPIPENANFGGGSYIRLSPDDGRWHSRRGARRAGSAVRDIDSLVSGVFRVPKVCGARSGLPIAGP